MRSAQRWVPALLIVLVTFICFGNSVLAEFVADDYLVIVGNPAIQAVHLVPSLFTHSYLFNDPSQGLYRPLSNLSFALNYLLGKLNPFGYHLFNLLLHALNGFLVYVLVHRYSRRTGLALLTSLLFVAHPVHTEAVSNIAGRPEMLASAGLLFAWILYSQEDGLRYYWLSVAVYFLALLAKESAIVLPGVLILADYCSRPQGAPAYSAKLFYKYAGYAVMTVGYLLLRISVVHQVGVPVGATVFRDASLATRIFTMSLASLRYFKLMLWPQELIALYDFSVIPRTSGLTATVAFSLVIVVASLAIGVWCLWRHRFAAFAILFFFVTISPAANLLFPTGILIAERVLYLPVCGVCLLVAALLDKLFERRQPWPVIALICSCLILSAAAVRDYYRNADWFSQIAYLRALIRSLPNSPLASKSIEELGARLAVKGAYDEAAGYLKRAVALRPDSVEAAYNTGIVLDKLNRFDESISYLERAVQISPKDVEIRNYYASVLLRSNHLDRARAEFEGVIAMKSDIAEAHNSLGVVYVKQQLYEKARAEFNAALKIKPDYSEAMNNLKLLK